MKSVLLISNIKIENANAISGLTYGFPGISNFLGFSHALSRKLKTKIGLRLGGVAVICHQHQLHAHRPDNFADYTFALTRNPLTKEGNTAPFNEEGRAHIEVSLLIECDFTDEKLDFGGENDLADIASFTTFIESQAYQQRLAGGTITRIGQVSFVQFDEDADVRRKETRKLLLRLLPGFVLVDRTPLLKQHSQAKPERDLLDVWLDFAAIKYEAKRILKDDETLDEASSAQWTFVPKPAAGWLVPITTGYKAISPLYSPGQVARTRDGETPFVFAESAYSVGEWLSPHKVKNLDDIIWHYQQKDDWYLCVNHYPISTPTI